MTWKRIVVLAAVLMALSLVVSAQTDTESEGKVFSGYKVQQSIEFGGRVNTGFGGNLSMYNSLVNLQEGPRLLDQSLVMRSEKHAGVFFDTLTESASGFGGDPNQIGRFRMSKNKWYDFAVLYRHDQYYSDYNILGNSLGVSGPTNPLNVNVFNMSPHFMNTRRTMADFDLKLLPQNWISFRVGYSRGKDEGPAYTSQHSPGDVFYLQNMQTRSDRYRAGVDVKPFAKTVVSYDLIFEHDRNTTAAMNDVNAIYLLGTDSATALRIDPGFTFDPNAKLPSCTFTQGVNGIVANSTCSGFLSYTRNQPTVMNLPTHQVSLVSSLIPRVDIAASASYTGGETQWGSYAEYYSRFSSPNYTQNAIFGNTGSYQVTSNADFKATVHLTKSFSVDEKFRWVNWRTPGLGLFTPALTSANLTATTILQPAVLPAPTTYTQYVNFLGENSKYNTVQLNWNPSKRIGGFLGYKVGLRDISDNSQTNTITIATNTTAYGAAAPDIESETEHHALFGVNAHPVQNWRVSAQADLMSSNGAYTLIAPRHEQTMKFKSSYQIKERATISGQMGFNERRNDGGALWPSVFLTNGEQYKAHTRSYGVDFDLHATKKVDVNLGWDYENISEFAPQCIPLTPGSANYGYGTTNNVANTCRYTTGSVRSNVYPMFSDYQEKTNTGYFVMLIRPVRRVSLNLGYDLTDNGGRQTWLRPDTMLPFQMPVDAAGNAIVTTTQTQAGVITGLYPWLPDATLSYNWYRPVVGVAFDLGKGLTFKGGLNNYDYHEKSPQPFPVAGRNFHGNSITLSVKHSF